MPKQLDPQIAEILKSFGFDRSACWDCHGTWVVYHRVLEQIAAKAKIAFDPPIVLEANSTAKCVALCVRGWMGEQAEWSIGEAAPGNNKNSYPYAMAEKRAKDRVVLKLIGLHGLAYSEDEADDFVAPAADEQQDLPIEPAEPAPDPEPYFRWALDKIEEIPTRVEMRAWWTNEARSRRDNGLTQEHVDALKAAMLKRFPAEQKAA